jgi:hypothetical protein
LTGLAAETVPLWVALAASLGSGVIGASVTAVLNARADRDERWRDRLIEAAEGFQEGLLGASTAYQDVVNTIKRGPVEGELLELWSKAVDETNTARHKHAAVFLVFGGHSPVSQAGTLALSAIDELDAEMKNLTSRSFEGVEKKMRYMVAQTLLFGDEASRAIWAKPRRKAGGTYADAFKRMGLTRDPDAGPDASDQDSQRAETSQG